MRSQGQGKGQSIVVPVGHIWKFDLKQRDKHDFGMKWNFSKIRIGYVTLNFLATTENLRNKRSEQPNYNRGKVITKQRKIAIRNFQI